MPTQAVEPDNEIGPVQEWVGPPDEDPFRYPLGGRCDLPYGLLGRLARASSEFRPFIRDGVERVHRQPERRPQASSECRLTRARTADDVNPIGGSNRMG